MFFLLVLVHLRFFHSVSCGWLPFWGSPAGYSFPNGRPYGKRSSSSSRPGGRWRFIGVRGVGSFFRAFGFPEVGAVSFSDPFRRLSVPPLAGLEGQGCGDLGCRGAAAGLLSALPQHSSSSIVPIPMPSSSPISITGAALEEVTLGLLAKGALELAPLPSPGFYSHLFIVWKTSGSWRPVIDLSHLNRFVDVSHFQMETIQSVLLSGLHRSQGSVSSGAGSSCFSSLSSLHVPWHGLPVQCSVLWPLHGSAGLLQGHGSCFSYTPFSGYPYASIPRRLAGPVFLSGVSPRGSADCPPTLSRIGDCHQPQDVQPHTFPGSSVSGGRHQLHLFQGLSVGGTHLAAALNSRRVSVLRLAYSELVAVASRRSFFAGSPRSWRQTEDAVPPALPPSFLEPSGSGGSSVGVDGVSSRSPVVPPSPSSISRSVSPPGVSRPTLLVRRLGCGMGCPSRLSGRFRPVGHPTGSVVYQRQGTARCSAGAFPVPVSSPRSHGGCLLRQHHSSGLPSQGGWHQVSSPLHLGSGDLALDGVPLHTPGSTVPSGLQQRPSRRPVSPSPAPTYRVVSKHDRLSIFEKTLAGPNNFICHLRQSSLFDLLLIFPGSDVSRHGRVSPVLGGSSGLRFPSGGYHSTCSRDAPGLHGDGAHPSGSTLGPGPLVLGPAPAFAGSSSGPLGPS